MRRVYSHSDNPEELVQHVAIAVHANRKHVGILHRGDGFAEFSLLHLAFHLRIRNEPPSPQYFWIAVPVNRRRARQVAAFCRLVASANVRGIPYAFSSPIAAFDARGMFLEDGSNVGLTCATFVLAVFHQVGMPLLRYESWEMRFEDREWQREITDAVRQSGLASNEHIASMTAQFGKTVRYRPLEVAGAGTTQVLPVGFNRAKVLAACVDCHISFQVA